MAATGAFVPDEIDYPGVYDEEGEPAKAIEGVPTASPARRPWLRRWLGTVVFVGVAAKFAARAARRRHRR